MRSIVLLLAACCALVLGACGGDDNKSSSNSSSTTASTPAKTTDDSSGGGSTSGGSTGNVKVDAAVKQAVASCKQSISAAPTLSDSAKADLNDLCEKAASGNVKDAQEATKQVCLKLIDDSGVPDGAAKDQAKTACNAIGA